jgi:hypothetical protein
MAKSERDQSSQFGIHHPVGVVDVTIYELLPDGKGIKTFGLASFPLADLPDIADTLIDLVEGTEAEAENV